MLTEAFENKDVIAIRNKIKETNKNIRRLGIIVGQLEQLDGQNIKNEFEESKKSLLDSIAYFFANNFYQELTCSNLQALDEALHELEKFKMF